LEDVFNYSPCAGYEAQYFDRQANQVVGGAGSYLTGADEPYARFFRYRASILWDAISYVQPWAVFRKEINDALKGFERGGCQEFIAYFVSSAGVGTQDGAVGQKRCLERTERMINQVLWRTHGMVKITLTADHGHSYTPSTLAPMAKYLEKKGWRLRDHLNGERDVVWIRFGLVTYASLDTRRPAALAAAGPPSAEKVTLTATSSPPAIRSHFAPFSRRSRPMRRATTMPTRSLPPRPTTSTPPRWSGCGAATSAWCSTPPACWRR
jgi:hypothetical protein